MGQEVAVHAPQFASRQDKTDPQANCLQDPSSYPQFCAASLYPIVRMAIGT